MEKYLKLKEQMKLATQKYLQKNKMRGICSEEVIVKICFMINKNRNRLRHLVN